MVGNRQHPGEKVEVFSQTSTFPQTTCATGPEYLTLPNGRIRYTKQQLADWIAKRKGPKVKPT